jgi:hypothetical protein
MRFGSTDGGQQQTLCPPTPYKRWENWTTVTPTAVMLTTLTPVQPVANQDLCTILM